MPECIARADVLQRLASVQNSGNRLLSGVQNRQNKNEIKNRFRYIAYEAVRKDWFFNPGIAEEIRIADCIYSSGG